MIVLYILFNIPVNWFVGNPLTQDILNLYQEPDGTRRLLNYLLDNLAGTAKRSKWSFLKHLFLLCKINVIITCCISILKCSHSFDRTATSKILDYVARTRPYKTNRYCNTSRVSHFFCFPFNKSCWSLLEEKLMLKLTNHLYSADQPAEVILSQLEHLFQIYPSFTLK